MKIPHLKLWIKAIHNRITSLDILNFFRQLSTLTKAGITLIQSLKMLEQAHDKESFRSLIQSISLNLESGREFNQCLQRYPLHFDTFCCHLVRIGEHTGSLDTMLQRITLYKEKNRQLQRQLRQSLLYPAILLLAALSTLLILLLFVVPHFASLFNHFSGELPALTRGLIYLSQLLSKSGTGLVLLILSGSFALLHLRNSSSFIAHFKSQLFRLPYFRNIMKKILLVKLTRSLATTLAAGIPLAEALMMVSPLAHFQEITALIWKLHAGINAGQRFHATLSLNPFFPPLLTQMVKTGENSGTLELMLEKFAEITESDIEQFLLSLNHLLEPLIIIILGVLIGGVVIAMYLPIFRLGTAI